MGAFIEEDELTEFSRQLLYTETKLIHLWTGSFFELPLQYFINNTTDVDTMAFSRVICAIPSSHVGTYQFDGFFEEPENSDVVCYGQTDFGLNRHIRNRFVEAKSLSRTTVLRIYSKESPPGFTKLLFGKEGHELMFKRRHLRRDREPGACWSKCLIRSTDLPTKLREGLGYLKTGDDRSNENVKMTSDWVDSIKCPFWPEEADEWRHRKRSRGWPSSELMETIISKGCNLISKAHLLSPESEWRFSFSEAELILIRSWSDIQKYVYHVLRVIKTDVVKQCGGKDNSPLCTYHFKTLMFWACEEMPQEFWSEADIESIVTEMLCKMISCLIDTKCPNYFIRDCNILDNVNIGRHFDNEVNGLAKSAECVRYYINRAGPNINPYSLSNDKLLRLPASIPNKLFLTILLRFYSSFMMNPFSPGTQRMLPTHVSEIESIILENTRDLYMALSIQRRIASSQNRDESVALRSQLIGELQEHFKRCRERRSDSTFDGSTQVDFVVGDSAYDLATNTLATPIGNNCAGNFTKSDSSSVLSRPNNYNYQHIMRSDDVELGRNTTLASCDVDTTATYECDDADGQQCCDTEELQRESERYMRNFEEKGKLGGVRGTEISEKQTQRAEFLRESRLSALFEFFNGEITDPFSIILSAYEANFHYTTLSDNQESLVETMKLCSDCLQYAAQFTRTFANWIAINDEMMMIVLTNAWIKIFDRHLQVVFGFVALYTDIVKTRLNRSKSASSQLCIHLHPVSFLQYIYIQCNRRLARLHDVAFDDREDVLAMELSTALGSKYSKPILHVALHISKAQV